MKRTLCYFLYFLGLFFFLMTVHASNNGLKYLKPNIGELVPKFSSDIFNYNVFVDSDIETINFDAVCFNNSAIDKESNYKLDKGYNNITIKCSNKNHELKYNINVLRGKSKKKAGLKSLSISNHEIDFNTDIKEYTVDLEEKEDTLFIDFETYNDSDKVSISGNENFNKGTNMVRIVVNSEEKSVVYKIKVVKTKGVFKEIKTKEKEGLTSYEQIIFIFILIVFSLGILSSLFYLLFLRKKTAF